MSMGAKHLCDLWRVVAKKSKETTEDDRDIEHKYKHRNSSIHESVFTV